MVDGMPEGVAFGIPGLATMAELRAMEAAVLTIRPKGMFVPSTIIFNSFQRACDHYLH